MNTPNKQAELEKGCGVRMADTKDFRCGMKHYTTENHKEVWLCPICKAELKGIKETKAQAISEFKEKLKEECDKNDGYVDIDFVDKTAQEITG